MSPTAILPVILTVAIAAFVGWITNLVAIRMIFRPYVRVRIIGPIGWQGVLPSHADHYAHEVAAMIVEEFFTLRDLVLQIDSTVLCERVHPLFAAAVRKAVGDIAASLPKEAKETVFVSSGVLDVVQRQLVASLDGLVADLRLLAASRIDELIDLRAEIIHNLTSGGPERLERILLGVAKREFRWIEYFGAIFGALFGMAYVPFSTFGLVGVWTLPVLGVVVGLATNWIAIQMIFAPQKPVRLGPFKLQGVLPARRHEIALNLAEVVEREMPSFGEILDMMLERGFASELRELLAARLGRFLADRLQIGLTVLAAANVELSVPSLVATLTDGLASELHAILDEVKAVGAEQVNIAGLVRASLSDMETFRFERTLRGLLADQEWILVAYGGVLGGVVGLVQIPLMSLTA